MRVVRLSANFWWLKSQIEWCEFHQICSEQVQGRSLFGIALFRVVRPHIA